MNEYLRVVRIEAGNSADADKVLEARIGHDEDLTEDGIPNYTIAAETYDCFVLVRGNLSEGFRFHGPFASFDDAEEYDRKFGLGDSWIATMELPARDIHNEEAK